MKKLFGPNPDLTNAFPSGNVAITQFTHKAKIEVDEEGTVAAAATSKLFEIYLEF